MARPRKRISLSTALGNREPRIVTALVVLKWGRWLLGSSRSSSRYFIFATTRQGSEPCKKPKELGLIDNGEST